MADPGDRHLNRVGGHPLYRQIADRLRGEMLAGELEAGAKLPTERELAERFGVRRETLRQALALLRSEGWLETRQGSGNYVRGQGPVASIELLLAMLEDGRGLHLYRHPGHWDLLEPTRIAYEPAGVDIARRLGVDPGSKVLVRDRLIGVSGNQVRQLATTYLPEWLTRHIPQLEERDTGPTGFLGLIEASGRRLRWTITVATRMPLPAERSAFQLGEGQPLLRLIRNTFDAATDQVLEVTDYRLPGARYEITVPIQDGRQWPGQSAPPAPPSSEEDLSD
jgi:GntR family transcriptional regulator